MEYHTLTKKLFGDYNINNDYDKIIRAYMTEVATKLKSGSWDINRAHVVDEILGLSTQIEHKKSCCYYNPETGEGAGHTGPCKEPDKKKNMKWCEHLSNGEIGDICLNGEYFKNRPHWNLCPICGTPKPAKKDFRVALTKAIYIPVQHGKSAQEIAEIALTFLKEHKDEL